MRLYLKWISVVFCFLLAAVTAVAAPANLDSTFDTDGMVVTDFSSSTNEQIEAMAIDGNGKIVAAGSGGSGFSMDYYVARYNTDGSLDTSFGGTGKVVTDLTTKSDSAYGVAIDGDGKIIVGGGAGIAMNQGQLAAVRYNADGSLDNTFGANGIVTIQCTDQAATPANVAVVGHAMAVDGSGKILLAGYAGTSAVYVTRLNTDGSPDTTFGGYGNGTLRYASTMQVFAMIVDGSGGILVGGVSANNFAVARFNSDGSLDTTFGANGIVTTNFPANTKDQIEALAIDSSGRIVAAGFTGFGAACNFALARFSSTGVIDTSFGTNGMVSTDFGSNLANYAYDLVIDSSGKILAAGYAVTTTTDFGLARYNSDGSLDATFDGDGLATTNFPDSGADIARAVLIDSNNKVLAAGEAPSGANKNFGLARYTLVPMPEMNLKQGTTDIADNGSYDYSDQGVGANTDVTFTIENTGDANLTLTTPLTIGGTNANQFSILTQPALSTIVPAGTTTFTVRFTPTSTGAKSANISIANNDSDENPYDLNLTGSGVIIPVPEMNVRQGATNIADGGGQSFGSQALNTDSYMIFTIENSGTGDLTLTTPLSVSGADSSQFSITSQPALSTIPASGNTTFTVRFTPTSVGAKTADISIPNNDADENPYDLTISGTGDDEDGVSSAVEDGVPSPGGGTGDGNGDSTPDSEQEDVTSLPTYDSSGYATLDTTATAGTSLQNVSASSPASVGAPANINMPCGVFSFEVHGVTHNQLVTMDIYVARDESITGYFKKNVNTGNWENVATAIDHTSVPGKTVITIELTESGNYDSDAIDTVLTDPGAPGSYAASAPVPALDARGAAVMGVLMLLAGLVLMRRKRSMGA